jgi:drug/metabolite transporter (DMT)-like permease
MQTPSLKARSSWPVLALLLCAFVGGTGWLPFRELQALGLHPLWALVLVYLFAVVVIGVRHAQAWHELARSPALWWLALAFGSMNAAFFWGVAVGDVVRVVLLFNIMPVWTAALAWLLLGEPLSLRGSLGVALALLGAAIVLWPTDAVASGLASFPWPRDLADWLGLAGGFAFAINTVMLRREQACSAPTLMLSMFTGGMLVAGIIAILLAATAVLPWLPTAGLPWMGITFALALWFMLGNYALQYGAARLPANTTSVVMLSEIVFAAVSSALLGAGALNAASIAGGLLILTATWLCSTQTHPQTSAVSGADS